MIADKMGMIPDYSIGSFCHLQGIKPVSVFRCHFVGQTAFNERIERAVKRNFVQPGLRDPGKDVGMRKRHFGAQERVQNL